MTAITLAHIHAALNLPNFDVEMALGQMAPGRQRMRPAPGVRPKQAGVLALLIPYAGDDLAVILTRRPETLRNHSGQISFPGGRHDETDESFTATALRETCEELGLCDPVDIVGMLSTIYIPPSNFEVHPSVGYLPSLPIFQPNPDEVAEVITAPLRWLLEDERKRVDPWEFPGGRMMIPHYLFGDHIVWGATAVMLGELEARLRAVR
ncbi:MAG TPA: CoA pyrophosphatase [Aggregatilineales bacterium]|nr:CoA pyrophosphatase [Aggregatilineales bacterium]